MNDKEIISIIAPAYNHDLYIIDALSSISQQTYYNKQLIIIDDCSKDFTAKYIKEYIGRDVVQQLFPAGIRFIQHDINMNAHRTINEGIKIATGKYIAIINTDDCYEENRLDEIVSAMKKENARIAFSKVKCIDAFGTLIDPNPFYDIEENLYHYPVPSFALAIANSAVGTGNLIFEKELYQELGGFSDKYHFIHDWDFVLRASLVSEPIFVDNTSYLYRFHSSNTIKQIDADDEHKKKKDWEVESVLANFLGEIMRGNVLNKNLKDVALWDYFMKLIPNQYCSTIWNKLKENKTYGI